MPLEELIKFVRKNKHGHPVTRTLSWDSDDGSFECYTDTEIDASFKAPWPTERWIKQIGHNTYATRCTAAGARRRLRKWHRDGLISKTLLRTAELKMARVVAAAKAKEADPS